MRLDISRSHRRSARRSSLGRAQHAHAGFASWSVALAVTLCASALLTAHLSWAERPASEVERASAHAPSALTFAENYYASESLDELNGNLAAIRGAWPNHVLRWEVESVHAQLNLERQGVYQAAFKAFESILQPEAHDSAEAKKWARELWPLVPRALYYWPMDQLATQSERLHRVVRAIPSHEISAALAWSARHIAHFAGDEVGYLQSGAHIGALLPLSVIGTWDNDQGKGLDMVYPPEEEMNLQARYQGKITEIGWRAEYPQDLRGKVNLDELLAPDTWQVAYAVSALEVERPTRAELRLSTTDPVKVWVNGELVLSTTRVSGWLFDGLTTPIYLRAGVNRVLIKSAQQTGGWMLTARVTGPRGEPLSYRVVKPDQPFAPALDGALAPTPLNEASIRAAYEARFDARAPARRAFHTLHLLEESGLNVERLAYSESIAQTFPKSLWLKVARATALWENNERGRAADLIAELYRLSDRGAQAAYFVELQARFWSQQRLAIKARNAARDLIERQPKLAAAHRLLASLLSQKSWHQERCRALKQAAQLINPDRMLEESLADCESRVGLKTQAQVRQRSVWSAYPALTSTLNQRFSKARRQHDIAAQLAVTQECLLAWPQRGRCYRQQAQALWAAERFDEALKALETWRELNPLSADPLKQRGLWQLTLGQRDEAVKSLEQALELDAEDQDLALRLNELRPQEASPWLADVPSDADIEAAIKARDSLKAAKSADQAYLLDDEVTQLKADGSVESITTQVVHALNQEGRDDLTRMYIGRRRTQLMAAYAINPNGDRVEASSIRKGTVRFRQLKIGSTVVLQYRSADPPASYLVGHISKSWWFQNRDTQVLKSRWVLWMPKSTELKEVLHKANARVPVKPVQRVEETRGDQKRVVWTMTELPPIPTEPRMPPLFSQIASLQVSTVPSWNEVFKWERELLRDAFRVSPEVEQVAGELFKPEMSAQERFYKIQDYVTRNIRYQQDYEHTIAGVKPHTAAQVLARQYGDCKDKAVLFITLAKVAGLKADFALVRTRDSGEVERSIPSQQFNHAIVYVPAQEGFKEGRFFDPTVDALDVQSLRSDDQGTLSLVYDPRRDEHSWRQIPFQSVELDQSRDLIEATLEASGALQGKITLTSRGAVGQIIRRRARNPESFKKLMQYRANQLFPGAQVIDHEAVSVDDLYSPAVAKATFKHNEWVRREGDHLRLSTVVDWTPKQLFQLDERRFPLVLGHRREWSWVFKVKLPAEMQISHLPEDKRVGSDCLSVERISSWNPETHELTLTWVHQSQCSQLSPEEYLKHRPLSREMMQLLKEEVVLAPRPQLREPAPPEVIDSSKTESPTP